MTRSTESAPSTTDPTVSATLPPPIIPGQPLTALAPMQDVTTLAFMQVVAGYGAPDYFVTEFFRVHDTSRLERHIVRSFDENQTRRPVFAQLIGESIPHLERTVVELLKHPIAGIDLNLGCPAPKVYKKNVGGGLLRDPARIDAILKSLRAACPGLFTVKMRIGFDTTDPYDAVLESVAHHRVDLLTVHGRTVKEGYRSDVHYDLIARAVQNVPCPVLANGNVTSATRAHRIISETGAAGVMIGRHAIRNPWIFQQCREVFAGRSPVSVTLADVFGYMHTLFEATYSPDVPERAHVNRIKKFLNFVGQGVDAEGAFLFDMRRTQSKAELFEVARRHLLQTPDKLFSDEPYAGVIARPNCETPIAPEGCSLG
ncbi:MAG: tRNA-dihydrouridine synthase family protein [Candidatus Synoicihabitans palmerolidicus]|nr:tRNA-dihydrouridine synthase family protein [Candidatus Synoicihabitans palmerolidicus]